MRSISRLLSQSEMAQLIPVRRCFMQVDCEKLLLGQRTTVKIFFYFKANAPKHLHKSMPTHFRADEGVVNAGLG